MITAFSIGKLSIILASFIKDSGVSKDLEDRVVHDYAIGKIPSEVSRTR